MDYANLRTGTAEHRAVRIAQQVGRAYPNAWAMADRVRAERGSALPNWPAWCFLPLHAAAAMVSAGGAGRSAAERVYHLALVGAIAAWRVSKGVYRFDPELYRALIETPLDRALPVEHVYRLPEWCVYIETPGMDWPGAQGVRLLHGIWVHLDWDQRDPARPHDELRLLLDVAVSPEHVLDPAMGCIAMPMVLGEGSLVEAIERMLDGGRRVAEAYGVRLPSDGSPAPQVARRLAPLLSLVLYLCADDPDFGAPGLRPSRPRPERTKRGLRFFPPAGITTWDVGSRIGAALRRHRTVEDGEGSADEARWASGPRQGPRPHIRRAHWHTYRIGPGRQNQRLRWLPPIPVKVEDLERLPTTIHPVKDS